MEGACQSIDQQCPCTSDGDVNEEGKIMNMYTQLRRWSLLSRQFFFFPLLDHGRYDTLKKLFRSKSCSGPAIPGIYMCDDSCLQFIPSCGHSSRPASLLVVDSSFCLMTPLDSAALLSIPPFRKASYQNNFQDPFANYMRHRCEVPTKTVAVPSSSYYPPSSHY